MATQRLLLSWIVWLVLAAIPVNLAKACVSADATASQSGDTIPALTYSHSNPQDRVFKSTPSVSEALSLQCERQSKKSRTIVRRFDIPPQPRHKDGHFHFDAVPSFVLVRFFFPRKLSPPSAEDDPFLS